MHNSRNSTQTHPSCGGEERGFGGERLLSTGGRSRGYRTVEGGFIRPNSPVPVLAVFPPAWTGGQMSNSSKGAGWARPKLQRRIRAWLALHGLLEPSGNEVESLTATARANLKRLQRRRQKRRGESIEPKPNEPVIMLCGERCK